MTTMEATDAAQAAQEGPTDEQMWAQAMSDADFGQSDDDDGADPVPSPEPESPEIATTEDDAPQANPSDDDPAARIAELEAQNQRLTHDAETHAGRYRATQARLTALTKKMEALQSAPSIAQTDATTQAMADHVDEYPDVLKPVADRLNEIGSAVAQLSQARERELEVTQAEMQGIHDEQQRFLVSEHPDQYKTVSDNPEFFHEWLREQPKWMDDIFRANQENLVDGRSVSLLLTRFKQSLAERNNAAPAQDEPTPKPTTRRAAQLNGARTSRTPSRTPIQGDPFDEGASEEQLWAHFMKMADEGRM